MFCRRSAVRGWFGEAQSQKRSGEVLPLLLARLRFEVSRSLGGQVSTAIDHDAILLTSYETQSIVVMSTCDFSIASSIAIARARRERNFRKCDFFIVLALFLFVYRNCTRLEERSAVMASKEGGEKIKRPEFHFGWRTRLYAKRRNIAILSVLVLGVTVPSFIVHVGPVIFPKYFRKSKYCELF